MKVRIATLLMASILAGSLAQPSLRAGLSNGADLAFRTAESAGRAAASAAQSAYDGVSDVGDLLGDIRMTWIAALLMALHYLWAARREVIQGLRLCLRSCPPGARLRRIGFAAAQVAMLVAIPMGYLALKASDQA